MDLFQIEMGTGKLISVWKEQRGILIFFFLFILFCFCYVRYQQHQSRMFALEAKILTEIFDGKNYFYNEITFFFLQILIFIFCMTDANPRIWIYILIAPWQISATVCRPYQIIQDGFLPIPGTILVNSLPFISWFFFWWGFSLVDENSELHSLCLNGLLSH